MNSKPSLAQKNKIWRWTAVDHFRPGILAWALGDHSAASFEPLWAIVAAWQCYFYVTDGWRVYPKFVPQADQIISKTYMARVEGENTRLRHYERKATSQNVVLLEDRANAEAFDSIVTALPAVGRSPCLRMIHTTIQQRR